ncbi:hypothetical protein [Actinacidiphila oryziradicis]|nr:hypothetical protein [Actinacidiphila oryziradicis]
MLVVVPGVDVRTGTAQITVSCPGPHSAPGTDLTLTVNVWN